MALIWYDITQFQNTASQNYGALLPVTKHKELKPEQNYTQQQQSSNY